ncbi:hypothetical protein CWI37_0375p0020 [Hamiltosporidium tvaerminnensis]|uniref:Uncharacterized protein n=2 Tax=Hamiltosporidium TaxID=1176354 RepID=A0A4V2JV93_9MICR|nr:hypothetical protein CWI37_0375p0020 [Hamiltosporidium tvaerminnensis]
MKSTLKTCKINLNLFARSFYFFYMLKLILAQETRAIHFYENCENISEKNSYTYSDVHLSIFVEDKKPHSFNSKNKISTTFMVELDYFFLKFPDFDAEKSEIPQQDIFIDNSILSYEDFSYFYKIVIEFPDFLNDMNPIKHHLIFKILSIFMFKKSKSLEKFISIIWTSILFNPISFKKLRHFSENIYEPHFPSYISKIVIVVIFRLFRISKYIRDKIGSVSRAEECTNYMHLEFIDMNENYLYIDNEIVNVILSVHKNTKIFLEVLNTIFVFHNFKRLFLCQVTYECGQKIFYSLSLFKCINELSLFRCSKIDLLIREIYETLDLECISMLNIIEGKFTIENEITFLKDLKFESLNYVAQDFGFISLNGHEDYISLVKDIYSRFFDDIFNCENISNILVCKTLKPVYDTDKLLSLDLYQQTSWLENLRSVKLPLRTYVRGVMRNRYTMLDFHILNLYRLRSIKLQFYDLYFKDFCSYTSETCCNIREIEIQHSTIFFLFLSKILKFPSLTSLSFFECKFLASTEEIIFDENITIKTLTLGASSILEKHLFYDFFNKMKAIKTFNFHSRSAVEMISILSEYGDIFMDLLGLDCLEFLLYNSFCDTMHLFPSLPNLQKFYFGSDSSSGTLYKVFHNNDFSGLRVLRIIRANIGAADKNSLEKFTHLQSLIFCNNSYISEISFSELFNTTDLYSLEELGIPKIEFTHLEFIFFSKLKSLKKLYIEVLTNKITIMCLLKVFNTIKIIEIKQGLYKSHQIFEILSSRLKVENMCLYH